MPNKQFGITGAPGREYDEDNSATDKFYKNNPQIVDPRDTIVPLTGLTGAYGPRLGDTFVEGKWYNITKKQYESLTSSKKELDSESVNNDSPPVISIGDRKRIKDFHSEYTPELYERKLNFTTGPDLFNKNDPWIQTYSGRRFNPTNPVIGSIVIQDIAHSLSMQCRFNGHCKEFYSVAQHSVLVSHLCDSKDALWGLLHDSSEAYLCDFPSPLKHSGKFDSYIEYENKMQVTICKRFGLDLIEPDSVKIADKKMLSTEARDLLLKIRSDWTYPYEPYPFKIIALSQKESKDLFMKRFFELTDTKHYEHYLSYE
jgi:hypothetical protein